jgi:hypothetical protein
VKLLLAQVRDSSSEPMDVTDKLLLAQIRLRTPVGQVEFQFAKQEMSAKWQLMPEMVNSIINLKKRKLSKVEKKTLEEAWDNIENNPELGTWLYKDDYDGGDDWVDEGD